MRLLRRFAPRSDTNAGLLRPAIRQNIKDQLESDLEDLLPKCRSWFDKLTTNGILAK
jgi:hypothetical protein